MKRAVCSEVPEFAAYFRQQFPEVRGKTKIDRPDPCFRHPRPAVFVGKNRIALGGFGFFPALPENVVKPSGQRRKTQQNPSREKPLKRKNRLSAVPTDQAGRTVARPHHSWHFKEKPDPSQSLTGNTIAS